jgi:uncharacterized protein (TIGR02453 family)
MNTSLKKETISFLKAISKNNNKEWFEKNRKDWEKAKENYAGFMETLLKKLSKIDQIAAKEPKKYISRINRDIRFSKDKSPYKSAIHSLIDRSDDKTKCPFFIHVQPGDSFVACGLWEPDASVLKKLRQEIDYNAETIHAVLEKKSFKAMFGAIEGEKLARAPQGYEPSHPDIELLKHKTFIIKKSFPDSTVLSEEFADEIASAFKESIPFMRFIDIVLSN